MVRFAVTFTINIIKEFGLTVLLAAFYVAGVYFAVAALFPTLALQISLIAAIAAMVIYLILILTRRDESMAMGLLVETYVGYHYIWVSDICSNY